MQTPSQPELEARLALSRKLNEIFDEKVAPQILGEDLPKREPGTHWTGPSGEHRHVEVPITGRTLTNVRNWGRTIT
jgi:hypothetical protein